MCEMCECNAVAIGNDYVFGKYLLERATKDGDILKKNEYFLVIENYPEIAWQGEPVEDPGIDASAEAQDIFVDAFDKFLETLYCPNNRSLTTFENIVEELQKVGYVKGREQDADHFLFDYLGKHVAKSKLENK